VLKDKTILYIVHNYNSFQKDPIEEAAKYFNKVYVLVRYKPISRIARYIPWKWFKQFDESYVIDLNNLPKNVEVIKTPFWYLPFGVFNKWLGDLHYKAVDKAIKENDIKFDIVHSHYIWSSGYVGMRLKEKYDVPFIVTGHGYDVYEMPFENDFWKGKITSILEKSDRVLTVSNFNKRHLLKLGIKEKKIAVVHNGFSRKLFTPMNKLSSRKELKISSKGKICVSVGSLDIFKGHRILLEAMAMLTKKYDDLYCYIVGYGPQYGKLMSLIRELNLQGRVFLVGGKPHDQIVKWIGMSDVFVIPSLIESASVVLLEALACGKPVVATNVGIIPDVLNDNCGIIAETNDPIELGRNIKKALNRNWDSKMIARCADRFSWENSVKQTLSLYSEVVK